MKVYPSVSLLVLLLAGWLAACAAAPAPTPVPCDDAGQTAVALTLLDENETAVDRVQVSYRVNGGVWQDLPERVNGRARIPGGGGGYEIRAQKPGYQTGETAVIVPAAIPPTCAVTTQSITLQMALAVCPTNPQPLTIQVKPAVGVEGVGVTAVTPNGRDTLACETDENGCQTFRLSLNKPGSYQLALEGLLSYGAPSVNQGVISYDLLPYEVDLRYGAQTRTLSGTGASRLDLDFAVAPDEVGCPLPDLRGLTAVADPDLSTGGPYPPVTIDQQGPLIMTDLAADECQGQPVVTPVDFALTVPTGTRLADVALLYWLDGDWQAGECAVRDGRLLCTAALPNPLLAQPYAVKAVVNGEEYINTQLPFDTLCILFPS
ncbi:MAG: hypothetical protein H6659_16365 [Ardenticatenaceae bacterium]|nr:hypothetical protein [Ardenticatenaceae bacterium]